MKVTANARATIVDALSNIGCAVYYGEADETATFPYVIYSLQTISKIDLVPLVELELNIVGYGNNTLPIENLCDTIEEIFDHTTFDANGVAFTSYFERKNRVESEDRKIIRRRMVFNFNLYEKG